MKLRRTTETVIFGVESLKSLKGQENLLLKNLLRKTHVENIQFLSRRTFFIRKYGIQSINEMTFKRTVTLQEFPISRHQIWCHAIIVQQMHACIPKLPSCWHNIVLVTMHISLLHKLHAIPCRLYASTGINTPYELKHFCHNVIVFLIKKKINYLLITFICKLIPVFMLVMSMQCLKTSSSCLCIACAYIIPHVVSRETETVLSCYCCVICCLWISLSKASNNTTLFLYFTFLKTTTNNSTNNIKDKELAKIRLTGTEVCHMACHF